MEEIYSIRLCQLAQEFSLEEIWVPRKYDHIMITTPDVNRPGLALAGFFVSLVGNWPAPFPALGAPAVNGSGVDILIAHGITPEYWR